MSCPLMVTVPAPRSPPALKDGLAADCRSVSPKADPLRPACVIASSVDVWACAAVTYIAIAETRTIVYLNIWISGTQGQSIEHPDFAVFDHRSEEHTSELQ